MVKGVFICRPGSLYDDCLEEHYHFPRQYLRRIEATLDDWVIYYEPRRNGGRQVYFATARVTDIRPDPLRDDHYYADVRDYLDFNRPVPFREAGRYYERSLLNADGSVNPGLAQSAVHHITEEEYRTILHAGFCRLLTDEERMEAPGASEASEETPPATALSGFAEPAEPFARPLVERMVRRPFRERAFAENVKAAYDKTCALTGLRILNGGGRPEVQAAHIRPVHDGGPDTVRNGLALSGTVHWMFDRGLISIADDYRILKARGRIPEAMNRLLLPDGRMRLPDDPTLRPSPRYLRHHRERIFKG